MTSTTNSKLETNTVTTFHHIHYQWCQKHEIMEPIMNCTNMRQYLKERYGIVKID